MAAVSQPSVPTCTPKAAQHRCLDLFVAPHAFELVMLEEVVVRLDASVFPHRPVRLQMKAGAEALKTLQWIRPTPLPRFAACGPRDPLGILWLRAWRWREHGGWPQRAVQGAAADERLPQRTSSGLCWRSRR